MIIIFEKGAINRYYIRFEMETTGDDVVIASFNMISVSVIENMVGNSTYLNVKFIDEVGVLINKYPVIPDSVFTLTYGVTKEQSITSKFKMASMKVDNLSGADTESLMITMDLIHWEWDKIIKEVHSKSWKDKKLSFVLNDIISEIDFDEIIIEETDTTVDTIQPSWTNANMLKWISKNSISDDDIGGYVYYLTLDNKFVFSTLDNLYNKKPVKEIAHATLTKDGVGYNFLNIENNYVPTLLANGFGTKYTYFDYNTKQYVTGDKILTDINERQLSDWYYMAESHMTPSKHYYGGRNINTTDIIENNMLVNANSVQKINLYVDGDIEVHIGDLINLKIPIAKRIQQDGEIINDTYSGYWLVWKIAHLFSFGDDNYQSHLFLTRNGINGKEITGLVKTNKGKELV